MNQKDDLSPEASKLLDLAREVPSLDVARREAMKAAVLGNLAPGAEKAAPRGALMRLLRSPVTSIIVASAIAGIVTTSWIDSKGVTEADTSSAHEASRGPESSEPPRATPPPEPTPAPAETPANDNANVPTLPSPHALATVKPRIPERRLPSSNEPVNERPRTTENTGVDPNTKVGSASSLQEEVRLVRGADAALTEHASAKALSLLVEHERRFPQGTLASERAMLVVLALCAEGRNGEAAAQADRFKARYPHSPLQDRLDHSCAGARP